MTVLERIASHTVRRASGCIEWTARCNRKGYGQIKVRGRVRNVHAVVWEELKGPIPDGQMVLHECDNRVCCNIEHLFTGTHLENMKDMVAKGRSTKGRKRCAEPPAA